MGYYDSIVRNIDAIVQQASPAETEEDVDKDRVQVECQQLYNYIKECRDPEE